MHHLARERAGALLGVFLAAILAVAAAACSSDGTEESAPVAPTVQCDTTVTTGAELVRAAADAANRGLVVCATNGTYGTVTFEDIHHPAGGTVTLRAQNPHRAVLSGVVLEAVAGLRIEDFRVAGGFENRQEPVERVEFVGNDIGGGTSSAFLLQCRVANVLIEGNRIHDIRADANWWTGWGITVSGDPSCGERTNLRVRYNTIERVQKDGIELGEVHGGEIVGNVFREISTGPGAPDFHTDSLMIWANSEDLLVKDNRITEGNGVIVSGTRNIRFENNLVAGIDNWCWHNGTSGSTRAAPVNTSWVNNTVYDCGKGYEGGGAGGNYAFLVDGDAPSRNLVAQNLLSNLSGSTSHFAARDNLIQNGPLPSSADTRFTPEFADQSDWQPTNLPVGDKDVGYKPAPAGHLASP